MTLMTVLSDLVAALGDGRVEVIDLTAPLSERTPILQLPPPFANTQGFALHEISNFDERGPGWYWNNFSAGEHVGEEWQRQHGPLPAGGWLLFRTGWDSRANDQNAFLNANETGPHTPGVSVELARWLGEQAPVIGFGVETVGTDAGTAHSFQPAFPCHQFLLGARKYGLTQLANLSRLPPTGSVLVAAPLPIVGGSGSPARVLAFVPR